LIDSTNADFTCVDKTSQLKETFRNFKSMKLLQPQAELLSVAL
jgi:hypothetical protein